MRTVRHLSVLAICGSFVLPLLGESSELVCPILLNGQAGGYRAKTVVTVINPGSEVLSGTVKAFRNDGTPATVIQVYPNTVSEASIELKQNELWIRETDAQSAFLQEGWVLLSYQGTTRPIAAADVYLLKEGETCLPESVFRVPFVDAGTRLTSVARLTLDSSTGRNQVLNVSAYALVNPSDTKTARVTLSLKIRPEPFPDKVIDIPPGQRVAKFLSELFPIPLAEFPSPGITQSSSFGTVSIVSDSPVACGAVDLDLRNARYSQGVVSVVGSPP